MTDLNPDMLAKATSAARHERAYIAAAAFGVPLEAIGECAGMIAHAVLSVVADDLRAEGATQALRAFADAHRMPWTMFLDANEMPVTVGDLLRAEADRIEHDAQCPHTKCPGGSLCCCADRIVARDE